MHKIKRIFPLFLVGLSVTSCGTNLRPEVADFIANFSFSNARDSVLKGHYIDISEGKYNGEDCYFYDEVIFDISEEEKVVYKHVYKTINYGELGTQEYVDEIETINGEYFLKHNGNSQKTTYTLAKDTTKRFFYSEYYKETDRYFGGMYYGDTIKASVYKQQDLVTISEDKEVYQYKIDKFKEQNGDVVTSINYKVNKIGMLISLCNSGYSISDSTTYYTETITVEY